MNEAAITKAVLDHWRKCGLPNTLVASIPNMGSRGQYGLTKGLPDLLVLKPNGFVGFLELKTEKGRLGPNQKWFAELCAVTEQNYACTFGREDPIAKLREWGVVK